MIPDMEPQESTRPGRRRWWLWMVAASLAGLAVIGVGLYQLARWLRPPAPEERPSEVRGEPGLQRHIPRGARALAARVRPTPDDEEPPAVPPDHPFARTRITGRVFDLATGDGLAGAQVKVWPTFGEPRLGPASGSGSATFTSLEDGSYAMKGVPPGHFDIEVTAVGYLPARSGFRKFSEVEDDDGFDFGLMRASAVEGRVVTAGGLPVAGARVTAVYGRDVLVTTATPFVVTRENGRFLLDPVDAREVTLFVSHPAYEPVTTMLSATDEPTREVEIVLSRGRRIVGVVRDKDGPVSGAVVTPEFLQANQRAVFVGARVPDFGATTGRDGRYALSVGASGPTVLRVEAPGYRRTSRRLPGPAAADNLDQETVVDFLLDRAAEMSGQVLAADGRPAIKAQVIVSSDAGFADTETDEAGQFVLGGLPLEGPYTVSIRHHAHPPFSKVEPDLSGAHVYRLEAQGRILGRIVDGRSGLPVTEYSFLVTGPVQVRSGAASISGALEIDQLAEGTYTLLVQADEYVPTTVDGLEIGPGETKSGVVVRMERGGSVAGRVRGPIEGEVLVQALDAEGTFESGGLVDEEGGFVLRGLREGTYTIRVVGPGVRGEQPGVRVGAGAVTSGVEVALRAESEGPEP